MGEEEDGRPPRPSTSISLTQGYYGTVNPYNLPYMMPPNRYPHPYPYAWGSQHLALSSFAPTMPSLLSSNSEKLRRGEDTTQHKAMPPCVPTMPYPHCTSQSSTMPSNAVGENNFQETYPHPYPYAWGSQHLALPPFGPTMPSPLSSNSEELRRDEDTTQHNAMPPCLPSMPYPHCASQSSTMPSNFVGEKILGATYPHLYPYAWGSQNLALPSFGPAMPSLLSSNPEELRRGEDTTQKVVPPCVPTMLDPHCPSQSSTMPFNAEGENNLGEIS